MRAKPFLPVAPLAKVTATSGDHPAGNCRRHEGACESFRGIRSHYSLLPIGGSNTLPKASAFASQSVQGPLLPLTPACRRLAGAGGGAFSPKQQDSLGANVLGLRELSKGWGYCKSENELSLIKNKIKQFWGGGP